MAQNKKTKKVKVEKTKTISKPKVKPEEAPKIEKPVQNESLAIGKILNHSKKAEATETPQDKPEPKEEAAAKDSDKASRRKLINRKPFFNSAAHRLARQILLCFIFIFNIIFLFVPLKMADFGGNGILVALFLYQFNSALFATTILIGGTIVACLLALYQTIRQQRTRSTAPFITLVANALVFCFNSTNDALSTGMVVVNVLSMLCALSLIALNMITYIGNRVDKPEKKHTYYFIINCLSFFITLLLMFIPFNLANSSGLFVPSNWMLGSLIYADGTFTFSFVGALAFTFALVINLVFLDGCFRYYLENRNGFVRRSQNMISYNLFLTLGFLVFAVLKVIVENMTGQNHDPFVTVFFLPFLLNSILMVVQNFIIGRKEKPIIPSSARPIEKAVINAEIEHNRKINNYRATFLVTQFLLLGALVACFFVKFLIVSGSSAVGETASYSYTAYELMMQFATGDESFRIVGFIFLVVAITNVVLYILSVCAMLSNSRSADSLCYASVIALCGSVSLIGISSLYYLASIRSSPQIIAAYFPPEFAEKIIEWLKQFTDAVKVSNQTLGPCIAAIVVALLLLIAKPLTAIQKENARFALARSATALSAGANGSAAPSQDQKDEDASEKVSLVEDNAVTFDACPSFTELDNKKADFDKDVALRRQGLFLNPSLQKLVTFVVDYARNSRLHLSYQKEDIATFVAGLGATKLSILQGMSGTGKTSLPKIFLEAIWGNCEIIEIESSWRDKNELLGYYNEFSHLYSPKKFTRALYKSALNPDIVTFIVLDEMNLSRIEYYFSDFLSLMENEEDKREIRLLNNQIFNTYDKASHSYRALKDNHTIVIPPNVWFVGTANRDESTFEISDKVYDRAYTMNFDRRAPAITSYKDPMDRRFLDYKTFRKLLYHVPAVNFSIEESPIIKEVEKALAPYNISFGNRILRQMETFINIYCNCFPNPNSKIDEALETILLSKVVHKLEYKNVRNKEELLHLFKKLKLNKCVEFVGRLTEEF
ncbi:MAG: hypothetical protein MJ206_00295 [Bacilli bacterium]|nr:hypothetical protein [Bacilli bacterium]